MRVAVIGGGLGGIAAAVNLRRRGADVTIFERSSGPGGTWWDNRYPGAACDIPSHYYSYSFRLHQWPRTHATQAEILDYVQQVIDEYGLRPSMRFSTAVTRAVWDEPGAAWTLSLDPGGEERFDVVVSALGLLNEPRYPEWPGMEDFAGPMFHTARWESEHDLTGRTVAVVGTGSTAAQIVPALAGKAGQLTLFSREPAWVIPKGDRVFGEHERRRLRSKLVRRVERLKAFVRTERSGLAAEPGSRWYDMLEAKCRAYFDQELGDRPDLQAVLRPDYPLQCKRPLITSDFYPALKRPDVTLVPRGVTRVTERGLIDTDGVEHAADVIVMATGFQPWNFQASLDVVGRGGRSLHGVWGDEPAAYLGINVTGFPNFFMMYGPNTNVGCVTAVLERQAEYIGRAVSRMARSGHRVIDVPRPAMDAVNRLIDRANADRTWEGGCHNYYHSSSGRNVTQWPWTSAHYYLAARLGDRLLRTGPPATPHMR